MKEASDVRLARIEEGIVHMHSKLSDQHTTIMQALTPLSKRVENHHIELAVLHRDRKWVYGVCAFIGGLVSAIFKLLAHS